MALFRVPWCLLCRIEQSFLTLHQNCAGSILGTILNLYLGAHDANSLSEFNANVQFALRSKLFDMYGNDVDANPYVNQNIQSYFNNTDKFINVFRNSNEPIFLSLNIQGLFSKKMSLTEMINEFTSNCIPVEISDSRNLENTVPGSRPHTELQLCI